MAFGRLGGGGNGMSTETPCDWVSFGFRTVTITVLEAVWETPPTVSAITPGAVSVPPKRSEQHKMPGPCGWMIAIAPGMKLLPVMVNVTWLPPIGANPIWPLCCVTLTLAIDGAGGGGGGGGVRVTTDSGEAADPPQPASAAANKNIAAKQHHARNRFWRKPARSTKGSIVLEFK